jgi:hypothetical protein
MNATERAFHDDLLRLCWRFHCEADAVMRHVNRFLETIDNCNVLERVAGAMHFRLKLTAPGFEGVCPLVRSFGVLHVLAHQAELFGVTGFEGGSFLR